MDGHVTDPQTALDVARFRKGQRQGLYARRKNQSLDQRQATAEALGHLLDQAIGTPQKKTIAAYWPIRGEPDLRPWMEQAHAQGGRIALPVMPTKHQPLVFHHWTPQSEMKMGHFRIPIPVNATPVSPDIIIVPLLGVDRQHFRLGNGGGYYDRTLARCPNVRTIGVGAEFCQIETIFPQPWDVPLHQILLAP